MLKTVAASDRLNGTVGGGSGWPSGVEGQEPLRPVGRDVPAEQDAVGRPGRADQEPEQVADRVRQRDRVVQRRRRLDQRQDLLDRLAELQQALR